MESNKINLRLISEQEAGLRKKLVWLTAKEANVREKLFMGELLVSFEEAIHELKVEEKEVEGQLKNLMMKRKEMVDKNTTGNKFYLGRAFWDNIRSGYEG